MSTRRGNDEQEAPTWRTLLGPAAVPATSPLALGVELRQRESADAAHWGPRRVEAVTPRGLARDQRDLLVGLRPLVRSAGTGAWVKSDVSWEALRRGSDRWDAAQVRWFTDLHALARDVRVLGGFTDVSEWLTLDTIESSLLWVHLASAASVGIPLVATRKDLAVTLADEASVQVELGRTDAGGLRLAARIQVAGEETDPAHVRLVGRSGIYAFAPEGPGIRLTLAPAALGDAARAAIAAGAPIQVPRAETPEFLREAYPRLARRGELVPAPGAALPPLPGSSLVLTVDFRPGDEVRYLLRWLRPGSPRAAYASAPDEDGLRSGTPGDTADAEAALRATVEQTWAADVDLPWAPEATLHGVDAAEFVTHAMPALEALDGVRVEVTGTPRRYRELTGDPRITVKTVETPDADWFDLGIMVELDGRRIPFTPLFRGLALRRKKLLLADGGYFSLAHPALDRLRELIDEAAELKEWDAGPRISRYQTALWEDFEDLADEAEPAVSWRETVQGLRDAEGVQPTSLPAALSATLRPYQRAGFDWLAFLWRHRLGGILADDMGLGKTLQILALIAHTREAGERRPFLVLAPTSVLGTWRSEAARFTPDLVVEVVDATAATRGRGAADAARTADIVVTSYTLLRLDEREYAGVDWAGLVLDEAQFVKNAKTKLHRAVQALRADVTIAVTGTPLENGLTELWALLSLTAPGLFPSARRFREEYVGPIEKGKVPENVEGGAYRARRLERLRRRIRPLILRRTKENVAAELPPKQEQSVELELSPAHRALYYTVLQRERRKVLGLLDDLDRNRFIVFRSLTLLRMLSIAPVLVDPAHAGIGSSKLDALLEHLQEVVAEGHRTLVFSQFTSFLALAAERLAAAGIPYAYLDGSTRRREDVIAGFRAGDAPVFLISLKAGGFGLTLTEADYVFLLDPWWNPAAESQAIDRTHRIGQERTVMVYRLIAAGTIEEKVMELQRRKARLFRAVMDDDELFGQALTAEDIRALLA